MNQYQTATYCLPKESEFVYEREGYELQDEIGQGGYGFVMTAIQRSTGRLVAIKFIEKSKLPLCELENQIPTEVAILKQLTHPNVIGYIDHFQDENYHYLVMELFGTEWIRDTDTDDDDMNDPITPKDNVVFNPFDSNSYHKRNSSDLFECIETLKRLTENQAKVIFKQILQCVYDLSQLGIYHRDIKDENIVIDSNFKVKLIDFGSAIQLPLDGIENTTIRKFHGTVSFASPEILLGLDYKPEPAEVWSLGVLLYTLLCGQAPFSSSKDVMSGHFFTDVNCSDACLDLIFKLLKNNPTKRLSIKQILQHEWLK